MHEGIKTQDEEHNRTSRKKASHMHARIQQQICTRLRNMRVAAFQMCKFWHTVTCTLLAHHRWSRAQKCQEMLRNVITHASFKTVRNDHELRWVPYIFINKFCHHSSHSALSTHQIMVHHLWFIQHMKKIFRYVIDLFRHVSKSDSHSCTIEIHSSAGAQVFWPSWKVWDELLPQMKDWINGFL